MPEHKGGPAQPYLIWSDAHGDEGHLAITHDPRQPGIATLDLRDAHDDDPDCSIFITVEDAQAIIDWLSHRLEAHPSYEIFPTGLGGDVLAMGAVSIVADYLEPIVPPFDANEEEVRKIALDHAEKIIALLRGPR